MYGANTTLSGPIFNGGADRAIAAFLDEAVQEVAQEGVNVLRGELHFKHETGYYRSQIQTENRSPDAAVTDGGVVYGPWLAGVGSRNKTSRFKGYAHWRRATIRLQAQAPVIAERVLHRFLRRMG